jgi:hypothetical protein
MSAKEKGETDGCHNCGARTVLCTCNNPNGSRYLQYANGSCHAWMPSVQVPVEWMRKS